MASVAAAKDNGGDDTIYELACECEGLFSQTYKQLKVRASDVVNLFNEYQHRFVAWAAYLGVFAEKNICLDRRLRRHPEVQDLIVRLLDVVSLNLQQRASTHSLRLRGSKSTLHDCDLTFWRQSLHPSMRIRGTMRKVYLKAATTGMEPRGRLS